MFLSHAQQSTTNIAKQIKYEHDNFIRTHLSRDSIRVYRGQLVDDDELELMKKSTGEYLSMNSFLSTSRDRKIALKFINNTSFHHSNHRILFEIEIDPRAETKAFADVHKISYFRGEQEVLLILGSLFCIQRVFVDKQNQIWVVHLSLASEANFELKETFLYMKEKIGDDTNLDSLGKILLEMGEYEQAKKCYQRMLEESRLTLSDAQFGLGFANLRCKEYDESLEQCNRALEIRQEMLGNEHQKVAEAYLCLGATQRKKKNSSEALECLEKSRNILEKMSSPDLVFLSRTYNTMAVWYDDSSNFDLAMEYYKKTLGILEKIRPPDHPDIAKVYNNLGCLCQNNRRKKEALEYYKKSLEISEKILPPKHPDILEFRKNIAQLEHKGKK